MLLGSFTEHTYKSDLGERQYWLYVPSSYDATRPVALVVMLHGCTQDGADIARGTRLNEWAERDGFIAAYPQQSQSASMNKCWNWFNPQHQGRGAGEPGIIAGITAEVAARYNVDGTRTFIAGVSAGAAMAGLVAAAYPDVYRAAALHSGPEFRAASNVGEALQVMKSGGADPVQQAGLAYRVMGAHARTIPVIVFHGARDAVVLPINGAQAARQWQYTNDYADDGMLNGSLILDTARGEGFTRTIVRSKDHRVVVEYWLVDELGHAWSGGSTEGTYTDPSGPDATREMLRFFHDVH